MVVADTRQAAEAGLEEIDVRYAPLTPVNDLEAATAASAPLVHPGWGDNGAVAFAHQLGDVQAAFDQAAVTVRERFTTQRHAGMPMEPRAVLAEYERGHDRLTVWSSTQVPHVVQQHLAEVFGLPSHRVRVMAPDVGGGFGTKVCVYPEDVLVPLATRVLGRAVKWTEERREHFLASAQPCRRQRAAVRRGVALSRRKPPGIRQRGLPGDPERRARGCGVYAFP